MKAAYETLRILSTALYVGLAVLSVAHWVRRRQRQAAWLAITFATLAAVLLVARVTEDATGPIAEVERKVTIVLLVLFPYFLFRFTAAFERASLRSELLVAGPTAVVEIWTLLLPRIPTTGEARPAWFQAYVVALLAQWTVVSMVSAWRLWRAGRGQPTVARRRMRMLAAGALLIATALIVAGLAPPHSERGLVDVLVQTFAIASAVVFYLGFSLPAVLRVMWRRSEEESLRRVAVDLMAVTDPEEVARSLLPGVARVVGGRWAALVDQEGQITAAHEIDPDEASDMAARIGIAEPLRPRFDEQGAVALSLRHGALLVAASAYTPFFGREEVDLLQGIGVFTDLALERAALFQSERAARLQVEQTNEELEAFVYSVSHDLKSPLISVLGYLELLKTESAGSLDGDAQHYVDRIGASALYMNRLITDLLELSRIGRSQTEEADVALGPLVEEIAGELRPAYPRARLEVGALPVVRLNPLRARQLLTNLIGNAVTHSGRSDVTVRVGMAAEHDGRVDVEITDDGRGIPEGYRDKVFGVFERLEGPGEEPSSGTGIGLAICRKIVEQAGGEIRLGSPEVGAQVVVTLRTAASTTGATT